MTTRALPTSHKTRFVPADEKNLSAVPATLTADELQEVISQALWGALPTNPRARCCSATSPDAHFPMSNPPPHLKSCHTRTEWGVAQKLQSRHATTLEEGVLEGCYRAMAMSGHAMDAGPNKASDWLLPNSKHWYISKATPASGHGGHGGGHSRRESKSQPDIKLSKNQFSAGLKKVLGLRVPWANLDGLWRRVLKAYPAQPSIGLDGHVVAQPPHAAHAARRAHGGGAGGEPSPAQRAAVAAGLRFAASMGPPPALSSSAPRAASHGGGGASPLRDEQRRRQAQQAQEEEEERERRQVPSAAASPDPAFRGSSQGQDQGQGQGQGDIGDLGADDTLLFGTQPSPHWRVTLRELDRHRPATDSNPGGGHHRQSAMMGATTATTTATAAGVATEAAEAPRTTYAEAGTAGGGGAYGFGLSGGARLAGAARPKSAPAGGRKARKAAAAVAAASAKAMAERPPWHFTNGKGNRLVHATGDAGRRAEAADAALAAEIAAATGVSSHITLHQFACAFRPPHNDLGGPSGHHGSHYGSHNGGHNGGHNGEEAEQGGSDGRRGKHHAQEPAAVAAPLTLHGRGGSTAWMNGAFSRVMDGMDRDNLLIHEVKSTGPRVFFSALTLTHTYAHTPPTPLAIHTLPPSRLNDVNRLNNAHRQPYSLSLVFSLLFSSLFFSALSRPP